MQMFVLSEQTIYQPLIQVKLFITPNIHKYNVMNFLSTDTGVVLYLSDADRLMKEKNGTASLDIKFILQLNVSTGTIH